MRVVRTFAEIEPPLAASVVAIGMFDGVHRGHSFLLTQARERAHERHQQLAVVTFDPCPELVLQPETMRYQLTSYSQKVALMRHLRPDLLLVLDFTPALSQRSADDFAGDLERYLGMSEVWMGEDFAFGHRRSGNVAYLIERGQRTGFSVHVIPRERWHGEALSSTEVRAALTAGAIDHVEELLGHPFTLNGSLMRQNAESWGLHIGRGPLVPQQGAYRGILAGKSHTCSAVISVPGDASLLSALILPLMLEHTSARWVEGAAASFTFVERIALPLQV